MQETATEALESAVRTKKALTTDRTSRNTFACAKVNCENINISQILELIVLLPRIVSGTSFLKCKHYLEVDLGLPISIPQRPPGSLKTPRAPSTRTLQGPPRPSKIPPQRIQESKNPKSPSIEPPSIPRVPRKPAEPPPSPVPSNAPRLESPAS